MLHFMTVVLQDDPPIIYHIHPERLVTLVIEVEQ